MCKTFMFTQKHRTVTIKIIRLQLSFLKDAKYFWKIFACNKTFVKYEEDEEIKYIPIEICLIFGNMKRMSYKILNSDICYPMRYTLKKRSLFKIENNSS